MTKPKTFRELEEVAKNPPEHAKKCRWQEYGGQGCTCGFRAKHLDWQKGNEEIGIRLLHASSAILEALQVYEGWENIVGGMSSKPATKALAILNGEVEG